ncbi:MAG: sugar transferase [Candidatus Eisenbacteria bacterium]|uniref:Sugar transferase n=1 Tax=Eiseniibacteriota bacterium TaxID=2212470 RepID=A0A956LYH4_UNCEI|nr:sugar transferase [Candidatus Eisenbacteria bacterium]
MPRETPAAPSGFYPRFLKPSCDRIVAGIAVVCLGPLLLLLAAWVALDSPGGAFFHQERVGRFGRPFRLHKFRSMVTGAEKQGAGALVEQNDSRITRSGKFLRATSLDELPQLFNIAKGEMSLIGPRPTLQYQVDQYDDFQRRRLLVKPGLTGLAQIRGRKSLSWPERIRADVEYVDTISLALDLTILVRTPATLLGGEGQAASDHWKGRGQG